MSTNQAEMTRVEINKSIMELNNKKEKLQQQIDTIQAHIYHLVALRDLKQFEETPLFDQLFGG